MKKILILSVGGSSEPIFHAINFYKPDFVYFICSSGTKGSEVTIKEKTIDESKVLHVNCPECGKSFKTKPIKKESIISQVKLNKEQYEIVLLDDPDDFNHCYRKILELSRIIDKRFPDADINANYSGGTKTMSVTLVYVAIMTGKWDISLNKGPRKDLVKIRKGDAPVMIDKWEVFTEQYILMTKRALNNYDYPLAIEIISEALLHPHNSIYEKKLRKIREISMAYDAWDKFDHEEALELLENYGKDYSEYIIRLKRILNKCKATGYEMVEDIILNAERRAAQHRYDDAIARLYRSLELFGQVRLKEIQEGGKDKEYHLGQVYLDDLDDKLRRKYEKFVDNNDRVLLALRKVYEFLLEINDPLGIFFKKHENKLLNNLTRRNSSILAHGLTPLSFKEYNKTKDCIKNFIIDSAGRIGTKFDLGLQLPKSKIAE
jgi:CRISPR-associated protein (TIGR02710 family)